MKEWTDKYNPFNSMKALVHVPYWLQIKEGIIPPPLFVSVDASGLCNLDCTYCNAALTMAQNSTQLSISDIDEIVKLLRIWKTRVVCVGGGGESLTNPHAGYLLNILNHAGIRVGVVTNGTLMERFLDPLSLCKWVGVSVNAGTAATHSKLFNTKESEFNVVLQNMRKLIAYGHKHRPGLEVTYKFLLHPLNAGEILEATRLAKDMGCAQIHMRPGDDPWFDREKGEFAFTDELRAISHEQIEEAREKYEDENFKVFGVIHKFATDWKVKRSFKACNATLVQCLISSSSKIELCCDRRGDQNLVLCDVKEAQEMWGSPKHKEMVAAINVSHCPRCTYTHINEIFENVVNEDRMMYDFI